MKKGKAIVVGGSIAGVSCAHALLSSGWEVVVIEKSLSPIKSSPTGAGLGLDTLSQRIISSWLGDPQLFLDATLPLTIDLVQAVDSETKEIRILTRDEHFNFRAAHWSDLHGLLCNSLPPEVILCGHLYLSFSASDDENRTSITVIAENLLTGETCEIEGDLLIAADGCFSSVRSAFFPDLKLKYSGIFAWRGVYDFSGKETSQIISGLRSSYPELGKCLYFNVSRGTHSLMYELANEKINWVWFINNPEHDLKGKSVTMKVSKEMIEDMHQEAERYWDPEFVQLIKDTKEPFINFIYDHDPLEQIVWGNVVLVGDAAHPTTPNGARSTNMAISDAAVLGKCLEKWGAENIPSALEEYQRIRLPVTSKQVLHSRYVGRVKQGLPLPDREAFDPVAAKPEEWGVLQHRNMPFFSSVPSIIG